MRWVRSLILLLAFAPLGGCKQGVGDRCQVQSDCADGLMCALPANGTAQTGGTCQPPAGQDAGVTDAATLDIATPADFASTDQASPPDGATTD